MGFWDLDTLQLQEFRPGILSKAELGSNLIMAYMEIDPHEEDDGHSHPSDQCGIVLAGPIELCVGTECQVLNSNQTYFIPAGVEHGWKTFDKPVKLLDVSNKT